MGPEQLEQKRHFKKVKGGGLKEAYEKGGITALRELSLDEEDIAAFLYKNTDKETMVRDLKAYGWSKERVVEELRSYFETELEKIGNSF